MARQRMIRWQIALTRSQCRYLEARAEAAGISKAAVIRELIEADIWQTGSQPIIPTEEVEHGTNT